MTGRKIVRLSFTVHTGFDSDVISSYHIYASCFPPFCGASSAKCLLFWHHFLGKIAIVRTYSETNWFNFIQTTWQIFTS